jgi:hypothetical protein
MVHLLQVSRNCADIKTSLKLNLSCIPPLNDLRRITVPANQFRGFAVAKMNNGTSCGQPYETSGGPPNSCAYTPGNFSIATQSAIETCCGGPPYEPTDIGLCVQAIFRPNFSPRTTNFINITKMTTTPPPLDFDHEKGYEIETKYKEAICQLHWFTKVLICQLETRYKLGNSSIRHVLSYDYPERVRPNRTGLSFKLSD